MRLVVLVLAFCVAACGFRPLYSGTNTFAGGSAVHQRVWIQTIPDIAGVKLRNALIDRFYNHGSPQNPDYILKITLRQDIRNVVISRDDFANRVQMVISAQYTLLRRDTRETIETGTLRASSSYNILSSQYTTLVTEDEARDLAIADLADKMTQRIGVLLTQ